jgi:hypothetical protein
MLIWRNLFYYSDIINGIVLLSGDDSVLLKYLNPNLLAVATVSPPEAATNKSVCDAASVSGLYICFKDCFKHLSSLLVL